MLTNLDNKKNANLISQAQYDRVKRSLNVIKKHHFVLEILKILNRKKYKLF